MKNDILSNLLAKEKIRVIRQPVETASFNIETRTMILPSWKNLPECLELMLICHEVGHALYTTKDLLEEFQSLLGVKTLKRSQFSYLNVVEDVRIEQLIVIKYPGVKRHFVDGYKVFVDKYKAFAGCDKMSLNDLLIDRINTFCKVGFIFNNIPFTDVEQEILDRVITNDSKLNVPKLAKEIYDYDFDKINAKKEKEETKPEEKKEETEEEETGSSENQPDLGDSSESEGEETEEMETEEVPSDEEPDEELKTQEAGQGGSEEGGEIEPEPKTALEEHNPNIPVDISVSTVFLTKDDLVIPWQYFAKENAKNIQHVDSPNGCGRYLREWRELNLPSINYLVKEFQMRAAAASMKYVSEHKTGLLNPRKLATHQIDKNIFSTKEIVEEGESHGVIIAIDFSGSMSSMVGKVTKQALMVAEFCKRTQIPFSVFGYTTGINPMKESMPAGEVSTSQFGVYNIPEEYDRGAIAFEILSSEMPKADYERAARLLMWHNCWDVGYYKNGKAINFKTMSGTPTVNAMLSLYGRVDTMKRKNNVDKVCVYMLTDGETDYLKLSQIYMPDGRVVDLQTSNKQISYRGEGAYQLAAVYKTMKQRYGDSVHVCGIRLTHNDGDAGKKDIFTFLANYEALFMDSYDSEAFKNLWKTVRQSKQYVVKNPVAADSWIFAVVDQVSEFVLPETDGSLKSTNMLKKEFMKQLDKSVTERNLLNFIVDAIK